MTLQRMVDKFLHPERIKAMENLLAQYTKSVDFSKRNLGILTDSKQANSSAKAQICETEIENTDTSDEEVNPDFTIDTVSSTMAGKFSISTSDNTAGRSLLMTKSVYGRAVSPKFYHSCAA